MKTNRLLPLVLTIIGLAMVMLPTAETCSCLPQHPQTAFCDSQYVIVAQVLRKTASKNEAMDAYKIAIKKEYKMSDEARQLLNHGKLYTSTMDSACGIKLKPSTLYAIAANSEQVGLCDFIRPYDELSLVEKRGLAGVYRKGCKCKINHCWDDKCHQRLGSCNWTPFAPKGICETSYGSCVPAGVTKKNGAPIKCHWRRSPRFGQCVAENSPKYP
ncbi:AGAP003319-PA [Anopheles gambiae str. PEST]|uniref:AGAP003319-PA n=1 Tax=Anopheles gambiae TaxID=7165 RepID=A0NG61_ANOGA|nr:AGAP003319-PA [Anopheles gambiae str. PEST]